MLNDKLMAFSKSSKFLKLSILSLYMRRREFVGVQDCAHEMGSSPDSTHLSDHRSSSTASA